MTILGFPGLTETGRRVVCEARGVSTEIHYQGPVDAVTGALASLWNSGHYVDADTLNPPVGRLVVRTPDWGDGESGTGLIQTQFDLVTNLSQRSAYEHNKSIALGQVTLDSIRAGLKANNKPALTGNASTLYDAIAAGQDSFVSSQFVFRFTQYFVNGTVLDIIYSDINRVYSNASLIAEANPTGIYALAIQEAYAAYLASTYSGSVPSGHSYGWLKQAPQIQNTSGNRSAVTVEYWLEAWHDYFYA